MYIDLLRDADSLVMLSGGMESTTLLYDVKKDSNARVGALFANVGQLSADRQYSRGKSICNELGVPLEYVDIPRFRDMFLDVIEPPYDLVTEGGYDPCGDSLAIVMLAALYAGTHDYEYALYGGTKSDLNRVPELAGILSHVEQGVRLNTRSKVSVIAPFIDVEDAQVAKLAIELGVDLSRTWSCTWGHLSHCGACHRCEKRKATFARLGVNDPTQYVKELVSLPVG